ncbi:uncharacterized protein LOC135943479 isoform X1 [Cloeon dipterum]|uniref:uncharacterized protein LOC135943479 isoform X1 n=1 Tax=Cloeon dipterum TaxID=197152 RepID=UPI00321FDEDE
MDLGDNRKDVEKRSKQTRREIARVLDKLDRESGGESSSDDGSPSPSFTEKNIDEDHVIGGEIPANLEEVQTASEFSSEESFDEEQLQQSDDSEELQQSVFDIEDEEGEDSGVGQPIDTKDPSILSHIVNWALKFLVSLVALRALLFILRQHPCFAEFPKDPRTLLKSPRRTKVESIPPGEYIHLGISEGLKNIFSCTLCDIDIINIDIGIDGVPLAKSGGHDSYPICAAVKVRDNEYVYTVGLYHGEEKPNSSNAFLKPMIDEALQLHEHGLEINGKIRMVKIRNLCADAPARSFVLKTKYFNGYFSCPKCKIRGKRKFGTVCFTVKTLRKPEERTDADFRAKQDKEHHHGTSELERLPYFDCVKNVTLDYMHVGCLGVMRKEMKLRVSNRAGSKGRLARQNIQQLDKILTGLTNYIPSDFSRKCRPLKFLDFYKATEFRLIMLYTAPFIFRSVLDDEGYRNILRLHCAMRILASQDLCISMNTVAQRLLDEYARIFARIYGKSKVSHNVHVITHLPNDVLINGPLDNFSCFKFENYYQVYRKLVRSGYKMLQQIARRVSELNQNLVQEQTWKLAENGASQHHENGPLVAGCSSPQYKKLVTNSAKIGIAPPENCAMIGNEVVLIENIATKNEDIFVIGRAFERKTDYFRNPEFSSLLGEFKCKRLGPLKCWRARNVTAKCIAIKISESSYFVSRLIHT